MESLKNLIKTMETMVEAHTRLVNLAIEKRNILVDGNIQGLQNLVNRESSCVDEIQKLEQQRMRQVQAYMDQRGILGDNFTLEELIKNLDDATSNASLNIIAKQLRPLIEEITHLNESNQQLLQTSLSYIQYSIGMHARKEPAIGYGPHATNRYSNLIDAKI
jgi:flagellar biosynthesis/type III secretory pathway chaperone